MNVREHSEGSSLGRIAAAARVVMFRFAERHNRLPDYADLREGLADVVERELLLAELQGLAESTEQWREARRHAILELLAAHKPVKT